MNINECYQAMGADYEEVFGRLRNEKLIAKFVLKFPDDPSFSQLKNSLAEKNTKEAFRAAHTLKGVAQNLGFTPLYETAAAITEVLRTGNLPDGESCLEGVTCNYTEPYGSEKVTYDGSDDHTDKLDPWFAAVVDEQSGNDCHYDKSDDISTCRPCQFRRTTSETGEYREPDKTDQKIDQITDGSFFPSEKIQGQINRQIGE